MLVHSVYFTMKPGLSDGDRADFREALKGLGKIETIKHIWTGTPAATDDRPVIDKDYDFALHVLFDSLDAHNIYQDHEIHQNFIQENSSKWERVRVFDSE
ncbi:MAG: Dabb family protein [Candidatus Sumerlaeia bacterium]